MQSIQLIIANKRNEQHAKREIEYCYEHVRMFKSRLTSMGLTPDDFKRIEDLSKFHIFEKKEFRKHFPAGIFAGRYSLNDARLSRSPSSGTTGDRLVTFEFGALLLERAINCSETLPKIATAFSATPRKHVRYAAPNCSDVECANPNSTMEDRLMKDGTLILPVYHDLLTTPEHMLDRAIEEIESYQPNLYYIDATHFAFLVRHAKKRNKVLPEAPIVATFSNVTKIAKAQINEMFSENAVKQLVSMSEFGWVALECEHGHLHLNSKSFIFEFINEAGEPASVNELAEVIITSLDQGALPHVRYRTGDMYRLQKGNCSCGSSSPIVTFEGRKSDFIYLQDTFVTPHDVDEAIGVPSGLALYQLVQKEQTVFELRMIVYEHWLQSSEQQLNQRLSTLLGPNTELNIVNVPYIETGRSGKFRTCIPCEQGE
jgi:phenylacetate-CoA ligase